jgi:mRNA-degrading endonuclease RelE of RelBE toxin-antitoxin system
MVKYRSHTTKQFRALFDSLPENAQQQARDAYILWKQNPSHPSVQFKQVRAGNPSLWSARISGQYRALGVMYGNEIRWVWIGTHTEYEQRIR